MKWNRSDRSKTPWSMPPFPFSTATCGDWSNSSGSRAVGRAKPLRFAAATSRRAGRSGCTSRRTTRTRGEGSGVVTYTPATDYVGTDSFTYTISDGNGGTATGTVNITVNSTGGSGGSGGTIGDFVWNDTNGNGIQDTGESGLSGVTVKLYDGSNTLLSTTTTDGGYYSFAGLSAGTYQVEFVAPSSYAFSAKDHRLW
jgi:hypothetical protein